MLFYTTNFVGGKGDGLHACQLDATTGAIKVVAATSQGVHSPLFVRPDPQRRFLFVADHVDEVDGRPGGAVASYALDPATDEAHFINRQPSGGSVPCYVSVSPDGRFVLVANYGDGTLTVLPVTDGRLGPAVDHVAHRGDDPERKAHTHSVIFDPPGARVLAADLGVDRVFIYDFNVAAGKLRPAPTPFVQTRSGAGPRHLAFGAGCQFVYAMTEYDNTVIAMTYDAAGGGSQIMQVESSLPAGYVGKTFGSDIAVHPSGRFLYAANRGHESIVIFLIDEQAGRLSLIGHESTRGKFPRSFAIDPTGQWLVVGNERSDTLVTFRIDTQTGKLAATDDEVKMPKPACVMFIDRG